MKILMITSNFKPLTIGGVIYNYKLYNYLKNKFQNIEAITHDDTPFKFKFGFVLNNIWFLIKILKIKKKPLVIIENSARSADLFFCNLILSNVIKKNIKIITLVHHTYFQSNNTIKSTMESFFESLLLNNSDAIIVISEFMKNEVKNILKYDKNILVAPPGLDKSKSKYIPKTELSRETLNLLYVGAVRPIKDIKTLLMALNILINDYKLNNIKLEIVGDIEEDKEYAKRMLEYVREKGIERNIQFHGRVNEKKLAWFYSNSDIFVFPSLWEGFGMVLIEAMYNKLPIIATNVGPIPYIVKDEEYGILFPPKDHKKMADAIRRLINSQELREKYGMCGYEFALEFDWDKTFKKIAEFMCLK